MIFFKTLKITILSVHELQNLLSLQVHLCFNISFCFTAPRTIHSYVKKASSSIFIVEISYVLDWLN